ncbi:muts domain V-domain-containing protein [Phycomyces nitens]|nr:muts domain V-domain-containing protein [Phycomyces nitens]
MSQKQQTTLTAFLTKGRRPKNDTLESAPILQPRPKDDHLQSPQDSSQSNQPFTLDTPSQTASSQAVSTPCDKPNATLSKRKRKEPEVSSHKKTMLEKKKEPVDDDNEEPRNTSPENTIASKQSSNTSLKKSKDTKSKDSVKLTPLESQVMELKRENPGVLIAVEVGYRYRFFNEDAEIASRILHIAQWFDHNSTMASIPSHRLQVHLHRLVDAGYKVGIVDQEETAALKSVGPNKSAPFKRKLKNIFTKSTILDGFGTDEGENQTGFSSSNYLMTIIEENRGKNKNFERVTMAIVAVSPSTGDVIYDVFEDGFMRSELETRMLHIEPCELLLPFKLSDPTEKIIGLVTSPKTTSPKECVRIERLPEREQLVTEFNAALTYVSGFYGPLDQEINKKDGSSYSDVLELPTVAIKALALTIQYLRQFDLDESIRSLDHFTNFSARGYMVLNGNTITNLEIFRNSIDYSPKGSLLRILDKTASPFGKRLLKKWVGRPLVNIERLKLRADAIEELTETDEYLKKDILNFLRHIPDIERDLCRIQYGRSTPKELFETLEALVVIAHALSPQIYRFNSKVLTEIIATLPKAQCAQSLKDCLNRDSIGKKDCKHNLFVFETQWPDIPMHKQAIAAIQSQLEGHLEQVKVAVKIPSLKYTHVSGVEYLLEVKNSLSGQIPLDWVKMSATKAVSRFHTKFISAKLKELEIERALLDNAAQSAYQEFMRTVSDRYQDFRDVVQSLAKLDCLLSLANVALTPDYVRPVLSNSIGLKVKNARHPMVEQFTDTDYIPNDINFDTDGYKTMILTGPNMGGKSSYIRQVALISIMGQIGSYVPAESAELGILDAVYTRMGAMDNTFSGESTFMVELNETAEIMKRATCRSLVILDELGRGTSTYDGMAIAYAVLHRFITKIQSITLFVTHYPSLAELVQEYPQSTTTGHMSFVEEDVNGIPSVVFLYKLVQGVSKKSYGLNTARLAGLPKQILVKAKAKSDEMEKIISDKLATPTRPLLSHLFSQNTSSKTTLKNLALALV